MCLRLSVCSSSPHPVELFRTAICEKSMRRRQRQTIKNDTTIESCDSYSGSCVINDVVKSYRHKCSIFSIEDVGHEQYNCCCDALHGALWHQNEAFSELYRPVYRKRLHKNSKRG